MHYELVDPALYAWAKTHGLFVSTQDRDWEVRSVLIVDDSGCCYQLWLDCTDDNSIVVHVWDFRRRKAEFRCRPGNLFENLEAAYANCEHWIKDDGHTRNPVLEANNTLKH